VFDFSGPIADTFARIHKRDPIELIEMEESFGWVYGLRDIRVPKVVKLHGPAFLSLVGEDRETPSALRRIAWEGRALANAKFITAPSLSTASDTQTKYGLLGRVTHARNPIEPTTMTRWGAEAADRDTALFVGRFDTRKGADIALLAFKRVLARKPNARLVFVGPDVGIRRSNGTVDHFEEFVAGMFSPAERSRIMYEGPQDPSTIEALRTKARVTIVASRWESAGYTAAEALAQGCPVVAMDCPGVNEVVHTDWTGMLSADVEQFSEHILELLEDPAKGAKLGANGRQYITDTHSPEVAVRVALKVYEEAVGR
jgi:glycosyltransferase involved in cell wall biosynthesis